MKTFIAIAALATLAAPVIAEPKAGSWQIGSDAMHIYYEDLDMNSISGRVALLKRVERAAGRLCDADRDCVAATVAQIHDHNIQMALADRNAVRLAAR